MNQDVIRGSVLESQSLNRYSYVQGNPINLTDPFGLSPYMQFSNMGHTILDMIGFIPGIGDVADLINAGWYALEGNYAMAGISLMSALPGIGSFLGQGMKLTIKGLDVGATLIKGTALVGYGFSAVRAGQQAGNGIINMVRSYAIEGKEVGWHTVGESAEVLLFATMALISGSKSVSAAGMKVWKAPNGSGSPVAGDASFMETNDAFNKAIQNRKNIDADGYYDVIAHGTPKGIEITHNGQKMIVDSRTAAKLIQNSNDYNGQNIRLLSCNTGALDNGFAQNLANKLNVNVNAPTNYLWAYSDGSTFVAGMTPRGLPDYGNMGGFKLFIPGGNK